MCGGLKTLSEFQLLLVTFSVARQDLIYIGLPLSPHLLDHNMQDICLGIYMFEKFSIGFLDVHSWLKITTLIEEEKRITKCTGRRYRSSKTSVLPLPLTSK